MVICYPNSYLNYGYKIFLTFDIFLNLVTSMPLITLYLWFCTTAFIQLEIIEVVEYLFFN